jgi:hypothetical protein
MSAARRIRPTGSPGPGLVAQLARPGGELTPRRTPSPSVGAKARCRSRQPPNPPATPLRPSCPRPAPSTSQDPNPLRGLSSGGGRAPIQTRCRGCFLHTPRSRALVHLREGQVTQQSSPRQALRRQEQNPPPWTHQEPGLCAEGGTRTLLCTHKLGRSTWWSCRAAWSWLSSVEVLVAWEPHCRSGWEHMATPRSQACWLARYNPAAPDFDTSDVDDDSMFPWRCLDAAPREDW